MPTEATGSYVYGVVHPDEGADITATGLVGEPVRLVALGGVAALVGDAPGELVGRRRELRLHAQVLEDALARSPVLPVRFGTVLDHDDDVRERVLQPRHDELADLLEEARGRVEVRVRGYYDEEAVIADVVEGSPGLQGVTARTFDEKLRIGQEVARAVDRRRRADADHVLARLEPLALASRVEEPSTATMVMNAAFLVAREELPGFDAAVDDVGGDVGDRVQLKYVGPVPPASFFDLEASPG